MKTRLWLGLVTGAVVAACGGGSGTSSGTDISTSYQAGPGPQGGSALYSQFRSGKKLVLHQRELIAVTPANFRDRLTTMEATLGAFDGVFLRLPTTGDKITTTTPVAASAIATDLQPLYALKPAQLKYNFAVVPMQHDLDAFDDWSPVIANFTALAKVARDAGLVGIVIDDEAQAGLRVNYPFDLKFPTRTLQDYRAQTQLVGKKIMQAIVAEFPDAAVVVLRGAAGADPATPVNLVNRESDTAQLLGPFFAGFVEATVASSLLVDGGTDYGLRTAEQFDGSAAWRRTGLASAATNSVFISDALRAAWPTAVNISFGLRELDGARGNLLPNDTTLWASTVLSALRSTDTFVWASFDLNDLTQATANNPWVAAATRAKVAAASPTGSLASTAAASGTGQLAQYFAQIDESELAQTLVDGTIDNVWIGTGPVNTILAGQNDNFSVVCTGSLEAPSTGTYTIFGTTDDGMQISIGALVVDAFFFQAPTEHAGTIGLAAARRRQGADPGAAHVPLQVSDARHGRDLRGN